MTDNQKNETPVPQVTGVVKQKPKLVIFDDKALLLADFTKKFEKLGYDVTPVYVSDGDYDRLMLDGKFKRGIPKPFVADTYRQETREKPPEVEHTLDTEMASAEKKIKTSTDRYTTEYNQLKAMSQFTYAVKSKSEVTQLLRSIKPDAVLSDMQMRAPEDPDMPEAEQAEHDDVIMGNHIMALAAKELPKATRAIHTGQYAIEKYQKEEIEEKHAGDQVLIEAEFARWRERYATLRARANADPAVQGYHIFPKDEVSQSSRAQEIDAYFKKHLARGRGEVPTPA